MKNVTVTMPEDVYRAARIYAAEHGTSISAMVRDHFAALTDGDREFARLEAQQQRLITSIARFSAEDRLDREALHDRAVR